MAASGKEFSEAEMEMIESAVKAFEKNGIRVMAEITKTGFHIIIPAGEIAEYFRRAAKGQDQLHVEAKPVVIGERAYIDIRITKR